MRTRELLYWKHTFGVEAVFTASGLESVGKAPCKPLWSNCSFTGEINLLEEKFPGSLYSFINLFTFERRWKQSGGGDGIYLTCFQYLWTENPEKTKHTLKSPWKLKLSLIGFDPNSRDYSFTGCWLSFSFQGKHVEKFPWVLPGT